MLCPWQRACLNKYPKTLIVFRESQAKLPGSNHHFPVLLFAKVLEFYTLTCELGNLMWSVKDWQCFQIYPTTNVPSQALRLSLIPCSCLTGYNIQWLSTAWADRMVCKIFTHWSFSRLTLQLSIWSIFTSVPYVLEKNVRSSTWVQVHCTELVNQIFCILTHFCVCFICPFLKEVSRFYQVSL